MTECDGAVKPFESAIVMKSYTFKVDKLLPHSVPNPSNITAYTDTELSKQAVWECRTKNKPRLCWRCKAALARSDVMSCVDVQQ